MQQWLPEGHLARKVVDVVEGLDLTGLERAYGGRGSAAYHPTTLLSLLLYGYATGCYSSRKIERATYDSLAFRYIACNCLPDHDTLATFRRRFNKELEDVFVSVLQVAREKQLSRFGSVSLDGTKIHANTSRNSALSYEHAETIEAQLKAEVQQLLALADEADGANVPDGMSIPEELKRREDRLAAIADAKARIEARAAERFAREPADYVAKLAARAQRAAATGKNPGGKPPKAPDPGPEDQINLTDEESRLMPVAGGGFEQCYNAQALVDNETMLVLAPQVTQATNDKQQVAPMLAGTGAAPWPEPTRAIPGRHWLL
jgi:transposase